MHACSCAIKCVYVCKTLVLGSIDDLYHTVLASRETTPTSILYDIVQIAITNHSTILHGAFRRREAKEL